MSLITLPADPIPYRDATFRLVRADVVQEFGGGAVQVTAYPKAVWAAQWVLPPLHDDDDKRLWRAALIELAELENWFRAALPGLNSISSGYAGPAPLVAGAGQTGTALNIDGGTPSALFLQRGDAFIFTAAGERELKICTADCTFDGAGAATVNFKPAIRNAPADNAVIGVSALTTNFRLTNAEALLRADINRMNSITLDAVEHFTA